MPVTTGSLPDAMARQDADAPIKGVIIGRATAILGVAALAVTQPLLDLFGRNPEFFVAGNYSRGQIVWFSLLVTMVPALVGIGAVAAATAIDRRAGTVAFGVVIAVFGATFVLAVLRNVGVDPAVLVVPLGLVGGAALAFAVLRSRGGRLLASYLAVANLAFLGLFLFGSRTAELVAGGSSLDLGSVTVGDVPGPVVLIVLDEFPAATIIRADGSLNGDRFPGFEDLASVSTWFRNASSQFNLTHRAVPSILDGRIVEEDVLPTAADHPRNLFTLLGDAVPVERYESVTAMCPDSICAPPPQQPLTQALEDASIVYGHRVLPSAFRDGLPDIDNSWGEYGGDAGGGDDGSGVADQPSYIEEAYSHWRNLGADERSPLGQAGIFTDHVSAINAEPSLHVIHVAIPHRPWVLSRTGIGTSFLPELVTDPSDPAYEFENRMEYQLHSMQAGAADALVSDLLDHLQSLPSWEDTLLVVTSDHGSNLTPPDLGRMRITDANREEVYRVPLFIKLPGQTTGEIRDDSAQTIDILPTIVDALDIEADWEFDGHSLLDGSDATVEPRVSGTVDAVIEIARRRAETYPNGDDWIGLAAVGDHGDLVGRDVSEFVVGQDSEHRVTIDQDAQFASLPTTDGEMPFAISGRAGGESEPPEMLVAINGRLAGVIGGYRPSGSGWSFIGYVADLYTSGRNDVDVYEIVRDGGDVTLLPAS